MGVQYSNYISNHSKSTDTIGLFTPNTDGSHESHIDNCCE